MGGRGKWANTAELFEGLYVQTVKLCPRTEEATPHPKLETTAANEKCWPWLLGVFKSFPEDLTTEYYVISGRVGHGSDSNFTSLLYPGVLTGNEDPLAYFKKRI